jgi:NADH-quinone oxidoreductase subunit C
MNAAEELKQAMPDAVISTGMQINKPLAFIKKESLLTVAEKVKKMGFEHLSVITGVDYGDRFEVIYNFFSYSKKGNLVLKVILEHKNPEVDSLTPLWKGADWLERETYDLVGLNSRATPILSEYCCLRDGLAIP